MARTPKTTGTDIAPVSPPTIVSPSPMQLLSDAINGGADVETLSRLMEMSERWEANQARKAFDLAMSEARSELPVLMKSSKVDFTSQKGRTSYNYADLAEITKTVSPILSRHGLSYRFETAQADRQVTVTCVITHAMGHSVRNALTGPLDESGNKNAIQSIGSTVTFLSRYTLLSGLGLAASTDTDGRDVGGGDTIDEKTVISLREKIIALGADEDAFVKYLGVETLEDLPAKSFGRARAALDAKEKKAKEATNVG